MDDRSIELQIKVPRRELLKGISVDNCKSNDDLESEKNVRLKKAIDRNEKKEAAQEPTKNNGDIKAMQKFNLTKLE